MSNTQSDLLRSMSAVLADTRDLHREVLRTGEGSRNHSALDEDATEDLPCEVCGHINEAEYELSVAVSKLSEPARFAAGLDA